MQAQYLIRGIVRHGNKRGRKMGFPTANINLHQQIEEGIYASMVKYKNQLFNSVSFIGKVKTFNETKYHAEVYIFSFDKDIYDQWLTIKIYKKLRGNKKFNSESELIEQMKKDVFQAKLLLANH